MAGRQCGRGARQVAQEAAVCEQTQTREDMPMCRHVNLTTNSMGCCSVERQLWELNQILDYQNRILAELLQAVRGE